MYGYVDIDGDIAELAVGAQGFVHQIAISEPRFAPLDKQDVRGLFEDMGLNDVKAVGISSVREKDGLYRNRAFIYTPGGRHGFLAAFGGAPGPFSGARLAPTDADFYSECEFDVAAAFDTVRKVVAKAGGPDAAAALDKQVKASGAEDGFSMLDVIRGLKGRGVAIVRFDPEKTFAVSGPMPINIPAFTMLVRIDGIGPAAEGALKKAATFNESLQGSLHIFSLKKPLPVPGLQPVLAVDGNVFFIATSSDFLQECLNRSSGLDANPDFVRGMAALGPEGNGVTWITPRFFKRISDLAALNPKAPDPMKKTFGMLTARLPATTEPLLSVRTNLPDGILIRSNWNRSLKADVAMLSVYNPVTVGLLAAMAVPAFQKVRMNSQEKAVLNNLRLLDAAADQFYLETGQSTATYEQLVGPTKFVKEIKAVAGRTTSLVFRQGLPLRVKADGRIVLCIRSPGPTLRRPGARTDRQRLRCQRPAARPLRRARSPRSPHRTPAREPRGRPPTPS